ncbi:AbrB/MazE/SpoVT family DNA-binding domain-containing protein [Coleofasciculus sp. E2-BRE-01]|uniref:AbrB/MazE/SpoVT family DNA-binding domain-containing protein n=1 Tax=Coleofasciculus sp. E2-BRE-01 TaxID=3069524 RepID=UPI0032F2EDB4
MLQVKTKISKGGRVAIPAEYFNQLGLEVGDDVIVRLVDGEIRIFTLAQAIQQAQTWVRSNHRVRQCRTPTQSIIPEMR